MVLQSKFNGIVFLFVGVYALDASCNKALIFYDMSSYPWVEIYRKCGDFINSTNLRDNNVGQSHMLLEEEHSITLLIPMTMLNWIGYIMLHANL